MTFGYNADAAFGNTAADIADHALSMLSSLVDKREEEDVGRLGWASNSSAEANILEQEMQRPIIFIAHSLGGIIVKQVRRFRRGMRLCADTSCSGLCFLRV